MLLQILHLSALASPIPESRRRKSSGSSRSRLTASPNGGCYGHPAPPVAHSTRYGSLNVSSAKLRNP